MSSIYLILHLVAPLVDPPHMLWGVRFFPWIDELLMVIPAVALGIVTYWYFRPGQKEKRANVLKRSMMPLATVILVCAVLVANIDAFVLGDGENVLFQIVNPGEQKSVREPLVLWLTKGLKAAAEMIFPTPDLRGLNVSDAHSPAGFVQVVHAEHALTLLGILCLIVAVIGARMFVADVLPDRRGQPYALLFLLGSGLLPLFAGYAEYYAAAVSLCILLHAFMIRSLTVRSWSWAVAILFGISCAAYVGLVAFIPTVAAAIWISRDRSIRDLLLHALVIIAVVACVFFAIGYSPAALWTYFTGSAESSSSHMIPFGGPPSIKHAYTAFSPFHALDLANLLLLVNPLAAGIAVLGVVALVRKRHAIESADIVLLVGVACSCAMMFLVNCDIGMVADWDLVSPFTVPVAAYALWVIGRRMPGVVGVNALRIATIAVVGHTILWMWTLADDEASIRRVQAMQNRDTFSTDGLHYTTMNIMRYYSRTARPDAGFAVMRRMVDETLPDDPRGYYTLAQMYLDRQDADSAMGVLENSIARDAADYRIEAQYAKMLRQRGDAAAAARHFMAYQDKLPPDFADSADVSMKVFYLGVCYTEMDSTARAIETMQSALRWDPSNAYALLTLAQLYLRSRRTAEAIPLVERARRSDTEPALKRYADSLLHVVAPADALLHLSR